MCRARVVALVGLALLAGCGWGSRQPCRDAATDPELAVVAERHAIRVVAADGPLRVRSLDGTIRADRAEPEAVAAYAPLLAREFDLYPPELVRRVGLRRVVLCRNLTYRTEPAAGLPHFRGDALYLDVGVLAEDPAYARTAVHHEFFHLLDYRDDGQVYRDPAWEALNPPGTRYGRGGWSVLGDPQTAVLTDRYPGFLNHYSTTGVEEDKAEVFAYLVAQPSYVAGRAAADPVLRAKAARMTEQLAAFCPEVDGAFWAKARQAELAADDDLLVPKVPGPGGWRRAPGGR
jgi:hypothetical protein